MYAGKIAQRSFPVLRIGLSALGCGWKLKVSFPKCCHTGVLFSTTLCCRDTEHNALIFHLIAIYILHRDTEGGGETDGHGHLDHISLSHITRVSVSQSIQNLALWTKQLFAMETAARGFPSGRDERW